MWCSLSLMHKESTWEAALVKSHAEEKPEREFFAQNTCTRPRGVSQPRERPAPGATGHPLLLPALSPPSVRLSPRTSQSPVRARQAGTASSRSGHGRALRGSGQLSKLISSRVRQDQTDHMGHHLDREMGQNRVCWGLPTGSMAHLEPGHHLCQPLPSRSPEALGCYFDQLGVILDVMQNHLLQTLCLGHWEARLHRLGQCPWPEGPGAERYLRGAGDLRGSGQWAGPALRPTEKLRGRGHQTGA